MSLDKGAPKGNLLQAEQPFSKPETITGELASGVSQFLSGFAAGGSALRGVSAATTVGKILKGAAQGAFADFAFFDGQEKRLSNLIQDFPALQNPVNEFLAASPDDGEMEGRFKNALEGLGLGALTEGLLLSVKAIHKARAARAAANEAGAEAEHYAGQIREALAAAQADREQAWRLRRSIGGQDRGKAAELLDRAVLALERGEPVDVGAWLKDMGLTHPLELTGRVLKTEPLIESGRPLWARDMPFDELLPLAERWWMDHYAPRREGGKLVHRSVQADRGEVFFTGAGGWRKYSGIISPDKIRLIPFLDEIIKIARWGEPVAPHRETHQHQGVRIHPLQAWVQLDGRMLDVALTVREAKNGKFFYDLGEIEVGRKKQPPPDTSGPPDKGSRTPRGGEKADGESPHPVSASGRHVHGADTGFPGDTLHAGGDAVNLEVRDITPDFSVARPLPEVHDPAPRPGQGELADLRAETGAHELEIARLEQEGRIAPEDRQALEAGRYQVRGSCTSGGAENAYAMNEVVWAGLKAYLRLT